MTVVILDVFSEEQFSKAGRLHRPALSPGKASISAEQTGIHERLNRSGQRWQTWIQRLDGQHVLGV
jgi:hypothetical protein